MADPGPALDREPRSPTGRPGPPGGRRVDHRTLHAVARAVLEALGSEPREASIVADHLVESNLRGHDSHGVGMLPVYVRNRHRGGTVANRRPVVVRDEGPFLVVDGERGFGHVIGREATDLAVARARQLGLAVLAIRNAGHMGRIGTYGEQCAAAGLVALYFVNGTGHEGWVAPHGGREARLSTNPMCLAFPATSANPPVILDFATSRMSWGKIRVWRNQGRPLPEGVLLDRDGQPTRDPSVMERDPMGALLPFGEHKGWGLALMCELLAGAVAGHTIRPDAPRGGAGVNNVLAVILDPDRLVGRDQLAREADLLLAHVRSSPPLDPREPVMVAGEPELRERADRVARGVPLDEATWADIRAAAEAAGTDLSGLTGPADGTAGGGARIP